MATPPVATHSVLPTVARDFQIVSIIKPKTKKPVELRAKREATGSCHGYPSKDHAQLFATQLEITSSGQ
jgi:hypothetical protein